MFRLQTRDNNFAAATDITKSFFKIRATEKNRFRMSNTVCGWRRADLRPDYRGSQKAELIHRESQRPDCRIENGILGWSYYCDQSLPQNLNGLWPFGHGSLLALPSRALQNIERRCRCTVCGWRRADLRPDYSKQQAAKQSVGWMMPLDQTTTR